jgi:hypothetical protein
MTTAQLALIGVVASLLVACNDGAAEVFATTSAEGSTSTTSTTPPTLCSADGLAIADEQPQGDLPGEVAAMRAELLEAATACDFDRLDEPATANITSYTFGGGLAPGGYWRDLEAGGRTPLADLVHLLNLVPALYDVGEGNVFCMWPAVYALPDWLNATTAQRQEPADLFGADQLAGWDALGGYIGYRVGITTEGRWTFFVAGA